MNFRFVDRSEVTIVRKKRETTKVSPASVIEKEDKYGIKYKEFEESEDINNLNKGDMVYTAYSPRKKYKISTLYSLGSTGFPEGGVIIETECEGLRQFTLKQIKKAKK